MRSLLFNGHAYYPNSLFISFSLDHIVIGVTDLKQAVTDFRQLGFHVHLGGFHSGGFSHNALIYLADGVFLELFAIRPKAKNEFFRLLWKMGLLKLWSRPAKRGHIARFGKAFDSGVGIIDFCLRCPNLHSERSYLKGEGIKVSKPKAFFRLRPDKITMNWELMFPANLRLPFVMGPVLPNILRSEADLTHSNGVTACKSIRWTVTDMRRQMEVVGKFLQVAPQMGRHENQVMATYVIGTHRLQLVEVEEAEKAGQYEIELIAPEMLTSHVLPLQQTHQARISILPA
ncbi:MAG: VOC family protein [Bacteroidota bacterium]